MGVEERVEHDGYAEQSIVDVERQVIEAARLFANVLRRLGPVDWERTTVMRAPRPARSGGSPSTLSMRFATTSSTSAASSPTPVSSQQPLHP